MYITIQQKINKIMILLLIITVSILIGFYFLYIKHIIDMLMLILSFIVLIFIFNYMIRFLEQNLEHHTIYKMLKNRQFALATIQNVEFYKKLRDSTFKNQYVYRFHIQIKTLDSKIIETDIYENINDQRIDCLPGDVYVTYDGNLKKVGIIPTLMLQMMIEIEDEVRKYETKYQTNYIVAVRNKGLSIRSISEVMKNMQRKSDY